jgi:hypothetical protein
MMDKEKLRKADIFSGSVIFLFGLWIVAQAVRMPMKDSYGGVQNVWYVSPALFPLFVGAMIALLGALLIRTALKTIGMRALGEVLRWLASAELIRYLQTAAVLRFYTMAVLLFSYVYLNIPRIDFFLGSILFLMVFIGIFYLDDETILKKMVCFYLGGTALFVIFFMSGISDLSQSHLPYAADWLMLVFIIACCVYMRTLLQGKADLRRKFRLTLLLAVVAPLLVGFVFKYLLLVPMPTEGLVVAVMDALWYWDF